MELPQNRIYLYLLLALIGVAGFYITFAPAWLVTKRWTAYWAGGFLVDKKTPYYKKIIIFLIQFVFLFVVIMLIDHFHAKAG